MRWKIDNNSHRLATNLTLNVIKACMKSNDNRRKLLKSIVAGSGAVIAGKSLPETWSKPVVNAVLLPAHAETTDSASLPGEPVVEPSQPINKPCELVAGCYAVEPNFYMSWPGGVGPHLNVPGGHQNSDCSDTIPDYARWGSLVIATSPEAAQNELDAISFTYTRIFPTEIQPAELDAGCIMYAGVNLSGV